MKIFKSILYFLLSLLFTLLVMEIYLSSAEIVTKSFNEYKEGYGRYRKANATYLNFNEGFGLGQFNKYGYLGPGYPQEKKQGVMRIALMGDSYVEGFQVFDRHHIRSLLEKQLTDKLQKPVEVLNFGRSGFNLADMYAYAQLIVQPFQPDIILYCISNGDLTAEQHDNLLPKITQLSDSSLTIRLPSDLPRIYTYRKQLFWMTRSALAMLLRNDLNQFRNHDLLMKKLFDKLYVTPLQSQLFGHGGTIEKINLSVIQQINPSNDFIIGIGKDKLQMPDSLKHLIWLELSPFMERNGSYDDSYHYWKGSKKSGHWNHEAHRLVANTLAVELSIHLENK